MGSGGAETLSSVVGPGVATGDAVSEIYRIAKANEFALPAVNCIGTNSINGVLEAANKASTAVVVQFSNSGGAFFSGKTLANDNYENSARGSVAGAKYVHEVAEAYGVPVIMHTDHCSKAHLPWVDGMLDAGERHFDATGKPLFSSHMLDLSAESLEENIDTCAKYFERMAKMGMTIEIDSAIAKYCCL